MTMKNDTKIEEEITFHFKIDARNFTNFDSSTWKSKKFVLIGSLWPKYMMFELQKYGWVIFHDTEKLCKFWRKGDLWLENDTKSFKTDTRNLMNFDSSTQKSKKIPL